MVSASSEVKRNRRKEEGSLILKHDLAYKRMQDILIEELIVARSTLICFNGDVNRLLSFHLYDSKVL